ncbi:DUF2934 domain-containing protein [Candidatus Velamenicoccus archaeovorus]|uniref:DUF2934 domain-containing protein n=1 Tax=Velamenicoccus archaeovorus TaxID=1930593 RepID=UPI000FFE6D86|nr:DUF2934 domain-containing protein [Candidatus Velamenicoccus archaeovorus]
MAAKIKKITTDKKETSAGSEKFFVEVQKKAYYLWEKEGKPQGKDWNIWLKAEKEVLGG